MNKFTMGLRLARWLVENEESLQDLWEIIQGGFRPFDGDAP